MSRVERRARRRSIRAMCRRAFRERPCTSWLRTEIEEFRNMRHDGFILRRVYMMEPLAVRYQAADGSWSPWTRRKP